MTTHAIKTEIHGILEIDHYRGTIYVRDMTGRIVVRVCELPTPIPFGKLSTETLEITHMHSASWKGRVSG